MAVRRLTLNAMESAGLEAVMGRRQQIEAQVAQLLAQLESYEKSIRSGLGDRFPADATLADLKKLPDGGIGLEVAEGGE